MKRKKLTIVISHPIQYHAPLYTKIAEMDAFDLHVIFHNDRGVRPYFDKLSGTSVSYDNNLLQGYSYEFLTQGEPRNNLEKLRHLYLPNLENRISASKPDAVYIHGYSSIANVRSCRFLESRGIKLFFRGENEDVKRRPAWRNVVRETFLKYFLRKCDALLYIGKENREFYRRRGVPNEKLFFVPYSADNEYFGLGLSLPERAAIRKKICSEFQLDDKSVIFINTCKHRSEKRPIDLVNAYIRASAEPGMNGHSTLLLVGDGPLNGQMRRQVASSGVKGACFTGFVSQSKMRELLLASDYCVNPAEEPWGCVFNEALPAGLGLISSDRVVGWPDMVRIGENGFVYRCGGIESLAAILGQCARHPEWREICRPASQEVAKIYSYETCVKGLSEALGV
jgi:glycosyltransferase involved in cell wall biosynthesis